MKSNQKILLPLFITLFFATLAVLTSCRKDPEEIVELITNSEAAEIIEDAVANRTAGFTMPAVDAAQILETYLSTCNVPGDTSVNRSKSGTAASYDYIFSMEWLVICSNLGVPQSAAFDIMGNGDFSSPHWSGTDATVGDLTFTGLSPQELDYIINGSYDLTGNLTGSLRRVSPSIDCLVALDLANLTMDKSTYKITGGSGLATVTASTANGQSKMLIGTIVFNGNGSATVTVNGYEHTFQWQ